MLAGAEALVGDFFLLMLAGGALATAGVSAVTDFPVWVDAVMFGVFSAALVLGVRPIMLRRFGSPPPTPTGIQALEGKHALVLEEVGEHSGQVKLDGEVLDCQAVRHHRGVPAGHQGDGDGNQRRNSSRLEGTLMAALIVLGVLVLFVILVVAKSVALVPQAEAAVIERLGRYSKTVSGQLTFLIPFADRVRAKVDLRERVVSFPPQPVITQDNLTLSIDTVVYFPGHQSASCGVRDQQLHRCRRAVDNHDAAKRRRRNDPRRDADLA